MYLPLHNTFPTHISVSFLFYFYNSTLICAFVLTPVFPPRPLRGSVHFPDCVHVFYVHPLITFSIYSSCVFVPSLLSCNSKRDSETRISWFWSMWIFFVWCRLPVCLWFDCNSTRALTTIVGLVWKATHSFYTHESWLLLLKHGTFEVVLNPSDFLCHFQNMDKTNYRLK